jgi:hypothetical protein
MARVNPSVISELCANIRAPDVGEVWSWTMPAGIFAAYLSFAPVAQLDRAPGYEPGGREFESLRAHQFIKTLPTARSIVRLICNGL